MRKEKNMAVTDAHTLERLQTRRKLNLAERQGRQALNIAGILKNFPSMMLLRAEGRRSSG